MERKAIELRNAIHSCVLTFYMCKRELSDLSRAFWKSLDDLALAADEAVPNDLAKAVSDVHRTLGAPGDFGYGTPCGDALRAVYDRHNELCKELR